MTVKRRVKKLEESIGGQSALHYLIVVGEDDESREAALARTLEEKGLAMADIGRATFFGSKLGSEDRVYHEDVPARDLIGGDVWKGLIKDAAVNLSLDPSNNETQRKPAANAGTQGE